MSFYSAALQPSATSATALGAANLYANHVSKTATAIDVVLMEDLALIADDDATKKDLLAFVKVAAESPSSSGDNEGGNCGGDVNCKAPATDAASAAAAAAEGELDAIPSHVSAALGEVAGLVTAVGASLVFTPLAALATSSVTRTILSAALPSGNPIASFSRLGNSNVGATSATNNTNKSGEKRSREDGEKDGVCSSADTFIAVDSVGNVYALPKLFASLKASAGKKAHVERSAAASSSTSNNNAAVPAASLVAPLLIVSAADKEAMVGALPTYGLVGGGFVGTAVVRNDAASGDVVLAVARENARDVRIIHFNRDAVGATVEATVIASYYPAHAPSSVAVLHSSGATREWETLVAVANGPLVTCYDVPLVKQAKKFQSPSSSASTAAAALSLPLAVKVATRSPFSVVTMKSNVWSIVTVASVTQTAAASAKPLAAGHLLWVAGSDRSVTLIDACRSFMRIHSAPNVLKYDAVSAALASPADVMGGGDLPVQVAVSGVDCEVRGIAHLDSRLHQNAAKEKDAKEKEKKENPSAAAPVAAAAPDTHNPASFRGRLNSAIHGDDVWVGTWRSFTAPNGITFAAGLTRIGTLYISA